MRTKYLRKIFFGNYHQYTNKLKIFFKNNKIWLTFHQKIHISYKYRQYIIHQYNLQVLLWVLLLNTDQLNKLSGNTLIYQFSYLQILLVLYQHNQLYDNYLNLHQNNNLSFYITYYLNYNNLLKIQTHILDLYTIFLNLSHQFFYLL